MKNTIRFNQTGTVNQDRGPSPAIWGDCPWLEIVEDPNRGIAFFDDFLDFNIAATQTSQVTQGRYKAFCSTAGTIKADNMPSSSTAGVIGGIVSALCDSEDDSMALGTQASPFLLSTTQSGKLWFEARIATDSILTTMGQLFVGLCSNQIANGTYSNSLPLGNTNVQSTTVAMIGFNRLQSGLGVLNTSYSDVGATTWTDIQTAANSTLAAQTWIKLGMVFDPKGDPLKCVKFFVDNVECTSYLTRAALLALTSLDAVGLGPCWAFFADANGTADYQYMDWWRCAQTFAA